MKVKILMVCLGNICRSPIAEGILKAKINSDNFFIDSAGTGSWHVGNKPDIRSITVSKKHHIDISHQKARQFTYEDYKNFDHIYVMDQSNKRNVLSLAVTTEDRNKVKLILDELIPNSNLEVPDPYYDEDQGFENVFQLLDKACENIAYRFLHF
jgi:protein-tyrosine phosphatase